VVVKTLNCHPKSGSNHMLPQISQVANVAELTASQMLRVWQEQLPLTPCAKLAERCQAQRWPCPRPTPPQLVAAPEGMGATSREDTIAAPPRHRCRWVGPLSALHGWLRLWPPPHRQRLELNHCLRPSRRAAGHHPARPASAATLAALRRSWRCSGSAAPTARAGCEARSVLPLPPPALHVTGKKLVRPACPPAPS
jgi:hypothetical protein